jgi:hypothetical protein
MLLRNMRRFLTLFLVICSTHVFAIALSDSSRISLLTCAPGEELYSCFGHSAIRVTDYRQGFDVVFNYGTFDYAAPNFYLNFLKGHMIYMEAYEGYAGFYDQYVQEQRSMYEQEIHLADTDRAKIFDFLVNNARPENCQYRYDFLWDNCATRIRDVFEKNIPAVKFDYSSFTDKKSFRTLINDYSNNQPWEQFGMGLGIGLPVDRIATPKEETFLPDYLSKAFAHATISGQPLCGPKMVILDAKAPEVKSLDKVITPTIVFGLLLFIILIVTVIEVQKKKHFYFIDCFLFFLAGLIGIQLVFLGGFTEHTTTQWNFNILWALPTHFVMAFLVPQAVRKPWVRTYFLITLVLAIVMIVGCKILPQKFLFANIMLAAVYAIRSYSIYRAGRSSG